MTRYHCDDYIKFLKTIRPDNTAEHQKLMQRCECASYVFIVNIMGIVYYNMGITNMEYLPIKHFMALH